MPGGGLAGKGGRGGLSGKESGGTFDGLSGVSAPLTGEGTGGQPLAIAAATASVPGYMTAAQAAIVGQGGLGWQNRTLARVISKLAIADESINALTIEGGLGSSGTNATIEPGWLAIVTAGGGPNTNSTGRGAISTISRGVTTGSIHYQRNAGPVFEGGGLAGRKWYLRVRVKYTGMTGFNAAAIYAFGASNSGAHASFIDVGVVAANSITKYSARITGTSTVNLISTVSFDSTTYRWVECWCDGTNTFLSVDDETPVSGAYVAFSAALKANLAYIVDATVGTRDINIDRAMWAVENPA